MIEQAGPLLVQVVLAIVGLRELRRHVFPAVPVMEHPTLVIDIWAPLVAVLPLVLVGARLTDSVRGVGFVPVAGPVCVGWMALALAALAGWRDRGDDEAAVRRALPVPVVVTWSLTGLFLMLLGAVNVLEIWIGQCAFAALAVLLWINAPHEPAGGAAASGTPLVRRSGVGVLVAVISAIGQGVMVWLADEAVVPIAGGLLMGYAIMAVGSALVIGPAVAVRIGGWAAVYGVLLTAGLLSLARLVPGMMRVLAGGRVIVVTDVADGFGTFAPEAAALLVLGPAALGVTRLPAVPTRVLAVLVVLAVASHIAWRLAGLV